MINYTEALRIAQGVKRRVDICIEYTTAYVFIGKDDNTRDSGYAVPWAVIKDDGKTVSYLHYVMHYPGSVVQEFAVSGLEDEEW